MMNNKWKNWIPVCAFLSVFLFTVFLEVKVRFLIFVGLIVVMNLAGLGTALRMSLPTQISILIGSFFSAMLGILIV